MKNNIIEIQKIYMEEKNSSLRLVANIQRENHLTVCWFEYPLLYKDYICYELCDAFVIALLPYAMEKGLAFKSKIPISEKLNYQIKNYYIPVLSKYNKMFQYIGFDIPITHEHIEAGDGVATGLSCGVDSFYTTLKHMYNVTSNYKITHLISMNVGSFGYEGGDSSYKWFQEQLKKAYYVAEEFNIPLIEINSNLMEFYGRDHGSSGTFRMIGAVLGIQKLISKYYIAAGFDLKDFDISSEENDDYDLFNTMVASNERTTFYSSGAEATRYDRTKFLTDYPITYDNLIVCWHGVHNCGQCEKCLRTIGTLYALDKLDNYKNSFDINEFYRNKIKYLAQIRYFGIGYMKPLYYEIYREWRRKRRFEYYWSTIWAYIAVRPWYWCVKCGKKLAKRVMNDDMYEEIKRKLKG